MLGHAGFACSISNSFPLSLSLTYTHAVTQSDTDTHRISLPTAEDQSLLWLDGVAENKYKLRERLMKILNEEIPVKI